MNRLKLPLREVPLKQKNGQIEDNSECKGFKGCKMNNYFKIFRHSFNTDKGRGFISLKYENQEHATFYPRHRKSATEPSQYYDCKSLKFLHTSYASHQKSPNQKFIHTDQRKTLSKIMIGFGDPQWNRTKKEQDIFVPHHKIKKSIFNDSIFSERQNRIEKRMFYYAGERHRQIISKLSFQRRAQLTSQIAEALVVKKYKSREGKSFTITK